MSTSTVAADQQDTTFVQADALRSFVERALAAVGMGTDDAAITADAMLWGDLRGRTHHGVAGKLPSLVDRIRAGGTDPRAQLSTVVDLPALTVLDGHNGWGQVLATKAMRLAMERARTTGVAVVMVKHSSSVAAIGYYPSLAAAEGMVGVALANATPLMPPWGGAAGVTSNSPHSIGAPAGRHAPVVFDSALSFLSSGTLHDYLERGELLPPGAALDQHGELTVDPGAALRGFMLPAGQHKGSGLAIMFEVLTGVLAGSAQFATSVISPGQVATPMGASMFLLALEPSFIMPRQEFLDRVDHLIDQLHAVKRQRGVERIYAPGERAAELAARRSREGIPFSAQRLGWLRKVAEETGVAMVL